MLKALILKFIWKGKGTRIGKTMLKMNEVGGIMVPDYKTCYKVKIMRTVWYWGKDRHKSRTELINRPTQIQFTIFF